MECYVMLYTRSIVVFSVHCHNNIATLFIGLVASHIYFFLLEDVLCIIQLRVL
jgi:hypothetical protein